MPLLVMIPRAGAGGAAIGDYPQLLYQVGFSSQPLNATPAWSDLSTRVRGASTSRGGSYEFDRTETGTLSAVLSNRDSALSPENSASPYAPLHSTRPLKAELIWNSLTYPLFYGITQGFPQAFSHAGLDATVEQQGNDFFYALNQARFTPGSTTLTTALAVVPQGTEENVNVLLTDLPMPQAVPFTITVAGLTSEWPTEDMEVVEIVSSGIYRVLRSAETTYEHPVGAAVTTQAVSFGEELSGTRIQNVLEAVGFNGSWWDLDEGQSLIAASEDLAETSPLEHIALIAAAEFGRFFVSREGRFAFRDRHSIIVDNLSPVLTFKDNTLLSGASDEVPYELTGPLEHSEEKLYNRVKITIQGGDFDGQIVDVSDQDSIDEHFERVFERTFPYARLNDAESAARFVLARNAADTLRLPAISVQPVKDASDLWPLLLDREIGDRCRFRYQPTGGGDEIDKDVVMEGISHNIAPKQHVITFEATEVDATQYWILGRAGYTELGTSTRVGF